MTKTFKRVAIAVVLAVILVISIASVAMAAGPNDNAGTCPNLDCPNGDCPNDGDQLQTRQRICAQDGPGLKGGKGDMLRLRDGSCQLAVSEE